ncbi:hypothetical protein FB451DRAFT_1218489 [Mycena latifolia]|nr:hypothetical protein FB451DRAFT_1218489 [Mycena latifolia]
MNPAASTDIHFFPPSSSVLVALSSLTPPSPILSAVGVRCSDDHIPFLLFDIGCDPTPISGSTSTTTSLCATDERDVICSGSVGTFGPLHRQSRNDAIGWSPNSPAFPAHSDPSWPIPDNTESPPCPTAAIGPSQATSTIQSSSCTHVSPSPSVNSCPSSPRLRRKFKFPIDCNDPILSASWSRVQVLDAREDTAPSTATGNTLIVPGFEMTQDVRPPLVRQPPFHCLSAPQECEISLPVNLLWLKDIVVELLIDQEGFRSVHPTFKLVGLPKQARGCQWDSSDGGLALFRPVKRDAYNFHWAPLDGLPILRRLTVNDDESRDYISRQASLSLRTNGVYTVQGSESCHLSSTCFESGDSNSKIGPDNTKLKWKFDYLVNDRLEQSGRVVDGEKTIMPLSFLCSPWLLHPSQARKMKFMHIVKKSVTTKLVAEKLEPPTLSYPNAQTAKPAVNHRLWTLHRRVHSSHADEPKPKKRIGSIRRAGENSETKTRPDENQIPDHASFGRRRRASSAGEGRRPIRGESYSATLHPLMADPLAKHIVPRAQLAELLNNEAPEIGTRGLVRELPRELHGLSPGRR